MTQIKIVALAGGVGGAKLSDGLAQVMYPNELTIIVNTGDDFTHLGLRISPDLDTVCYTLAGLENPDTGWGRKNETWSVLDHLKKMGMPDWFQLGDADLATHIFRTKKISDGMSLSQVTKELCRIWGIQVPILPMSDDPIHTQVYTDEGTLDFQEYFVHRKCLPAVNGFHFQGVRDALPAPGVIEAIETANAVIICPSNPWVSIDPIVSVPGIKTVLEKSKVIAVSPIIGNLAIKGPAAKMFAELGIEPSAVAVARHYGSIIDWIVINRTDEKMKESILSAGIEPFTADILMKSREDRIRLAREILNLINRWDSDFR